MYEGGYGWGIWVRDMGEGERMCGRAGYPAGFPGVTTCTYMRPIGTTCTHMLPGGTTYTHSCMHYTHLAACVTFSGD